MEKKSFLSLLFCVLLIFSCGNDDMQSESSPATVGIEKGRAMQVAELYGNQIEPSQSRHITLLTTLGAEIINFSNHPTEISLFTVKNAWENAFLQWSSMSIYNVGTIQNSFIHTRIHQWPVEVSVIEDTIKGDAAIDSAFITSTGANAKGYGAIEYLLYHASGDVVISEFSSEADTQRRAQYLVALVKNLQEQATALQLLWVDVAPRFKERLETGVNGTQNQVVNALIAGLETIKNQKIEPALNNQGMPMEELEAFRSGLSKEAIAKNLKAIFETYKGDFFDNEGFGLEEYTVQVLQREDLDKAIKTAFAKATSHLNEIDSPLKDSLKDNPESIEKFRQSVEDLVGVFKADFASAANIVVTFTDNDGD